MKSPHYHPLGRQLGLVTFFYCKPREISKQAKRERPATVWYRCFLDHAKNTMCNLHSNGTQPTAILLHSTHVSILVDGKQSNPDFGFDLYS